MALDCGANYLPTDNILRQKRNEERKTGEENEDRETESERVMKKERIKVIKKMG